MRRWTWVLGWTGGLALLMAGALALVVGTDHESVLRFGVGGMVGVVAWLLADRDAVGRALSTRSFSLGAGSVVLVALTAALGVATYGLARRWDHTWDLTGTGTHALSASSVAAAEGLTEPITVRAWFRKGSRERDRFKDLLDLYQEHSDQLAVTWLDPLSDVREAEADTITGVDGTVLLTRPDGRKQRVEGTIDEAHLTRALLLLVAGEDHLVCWSEGHGEPDPDDAQGPAGMGSVVLALEGLNYQVRGMPIGVDGVPGDCDVVALIAPKTDFLPAEREAVVAHVAGGGHLLALLEPGRTPELAAEFARVGVTVGEDVVLDFNTGNMLLGVNDPAFVVLSYDNLAPHVITRNLGAAIVLGIARSVAFDADRAGVKGLELLHTSADAWAETAPEQDPVQPDAGVDRVGEVPTAVVLTVEDPATIPLATRPEGAAAIDVPLVPTGAELAGAAAGTPELGVAPAWKGVPAGFAPKAGGRLVVVGDADFASNQYLALGNNRDLFLNAVAWLAAEEAQIAERPPEGDGLELDVISGAFVMLLELVLVPGLLAAGALWTWWRRRAL